MKIAATILTFILAFLTIQPVFSTTVEPKETKCCMKDKKCPKKENTNCDQNACNPLRVCVYGCPFLIENYATEILIPVIAGKKITAVNDYRTSSRLSACWHPPRIA
jgi:hypothetical protein